MPKQFCQTCGTGTAYELTRPKFCCGCGGSFTSTASVPVKVSATPPQRRRAPVYEEPPEEEEFFDLSIDVDIFDPVYVQPQRSFTLEDIKNGAQVPAKSVIAAQGAAACKKMAREMEKQAREKNRKSTEVGS